MRTLLQIVDAVKDGCYADADELRYALLALDSLHTFDHMDLLRLSQKIDHQAVKIRAEESFRRSKTAFATSPRKWLGDSVPESPEYQRRRRAAFAVLRKVEKDAADV